MKKLLVLAVVACMVLGFAGLALAQSGRLEIFSWWAGDEGPALEALIAKYNEMYPDVELVNATVTGGSGVNARAVLKTRMLGGDPPELVPGSRRPGTDWHLGDRGPDGRPDLPLR